MTLLQRPIGILGGTFDPIHFGHLRTAIELQQTLNFAKVHLLPCHEPVHRTPPTASPQARLLMIQQAILHEPTLVADDTEIQRAGPSYMIDTLCTLQKRFPNTPLCLIMGVDTFLGFPSWRRSEEILEKAHIIIAHRPSYHLSETDPISDLLKKHLTEDVSLLHSNTSGSILFHAATALDISSTDIRQCISDHKNPRYLLPDNVIDTILKNKIYHTT